jgi:agmatinase
MSNHELFASQTNVFSGFKRSLEDANYAILGVPFDVTSTYRTGARFGPAAIRQASLNIETYSFRTGLDVEDLRLHDLGDLHVSADTKETLRMLRMVVLSIVKKGKTPVIIGGEHTITLGALGGLNVNASKTAIVSFDAHLDLRDEYMGLRISHTTFMRRLNEEVRPAHIIEIGTRAVCKDELAYARKAKVNFFTSPQISTEGVTRIVSKLREELEGVDSIYFSIDMDVLDPAFVPAVQNPEPGGLEPKVLFELLNGIVDKRTIGFDVLEIAPVYDQGISAVVAAKVIFEMLCLIEKARRG